MATWDEVFKRIVEAIKRKTAERDIRCSVCNHQNWAIPSDFVSLPITRTWGEFVIGGRTFPLIPMLCANCGNTILLNAKILGFENLDELKFDEPEQQASGPEQAEKADGSQ